MAVVNEVSTVSHIPQFVPFGLLYYTQDTGDLYIGTGFSTGSDYVGGNPGPNVNVELISSPGGLPGGFNGDIQYNNNGNLGGSAATITAAGAIGALSITATSATIGALTATAENIVTSTITSAFVTNETVTTLTATTATITTGNIATLVSPAATITTATITNDHIANAFITTATVTSTLELQTATIVDSLGSTGTVGQALESTGTGVKWAAVSSTETWAALTGAMTYTQVAPWYNATSTVDSGISRLGAASLAIGNGTAGDYSGTLQLKTLILNNGGAQGSLQFVNANNAISFVSNYMRFVNQGNSLAGIDLNANFLEASTGVYGFSSAANNFTAADTGISRLAAGSIAVGNGISGNTSGQITATTHTVAASGAAPTSAGTAGTVGQIIANGGKLYFCSASGSAGSATWNTITLVPIS